eukprot:c7779_g1_i1.p1 GENE.c7779_g1_i1~~c7779_g1_i1.p1  ORF type:complete len:558 (+),score=122.98 c7779_g1_i1:41-1714(+)
MQFLSRRSAVYGCRGSVASSQPLASGAGLDVLKAGGNAADACVAMAAVLGVTEPCSTGIGGDVFALFFNSQTQKVQALLGSGRSPKQLSLSSLSERGVNLSNPWEPHSALCVTVPGAAAAWADVCEHWGSMTLSTVLQPAIHYASKGFPVSPITSHHWAHQAHLLKSKNGITGGGLLTANGTAPTAGHVMVMPQLANTLSELAQSGKDGFYRGRIANAIATTVAQHGGVLTEEDLANHTSNFVDPISCQYRGFEIFEVPPPTQGLAALLALRILEGFDVPAMQRNSSAHLHLLVESLRLAFADTQNFVCDPSVGNVPVAELLSDAHIESRRKLIGDHSISNIPTNLGAHSETVYFCAVDGQGNACSMINSNYMGFGTCIVPTDCGFSLQNRGYNFSLDCDHPNAVAPTKRPYHTIIPGMCTRNGQFEFTFGVMGGFMQPQGHVQVLSNMIDFGMGPQEALDAPRICLTPQPIPNHTPITPIPSRSNTLGHSCVVNLEHGLATPESIAELSQKGHVIQHVTGHDRALFGRGQIIRRLEEGNALCAGSDPRADGCAMAF